MAKFEITGPDGARYEVEAPDEEAAVSAFQQQTGAVSAPPSNDQRYTQALDQVRASQFPGMTDEQWQQQAAVAFPKSDFNDAVEGAQLFGFNDEIGSAMGALGSQVRQWTGGGGPGFGEAYGQYANLNEARRNAGREQMGEPLALAAEVLGGSTILGPARAAGGAVAPAVTQGASRLRTALTGLGTGAGMGALYGLGATDGGAAERGAGALVGGTVGGVVGAAAPYLAEAGVGAYGAIRNNLARNAAARDMGVEPAAASILRQITGADQSLGPAGQQGMNAAGREAMLLDAGPNGQQAADYLMRKPGQAASVVSDALTGRASRDAGELQNALNLYLGDPQGLATMRRNIATASADDRTNAYNAAYDAVIDYDKPEGAAILSLFRNLPESARASANKLMKAELGPGAPELPLNLARLPTVRDIDYITRALNLEASAGEGAGKLGGQTDLGRAYGNLAGNIRNKARVAAPAYGNALETAADPISQSQATKLGYDILSPNLPRDEAAMQMANMTSPEKEAVALGIRSRIDENLANVSRAVTTGREEEVTQAIRAMRDLTKPANRSKVALAIGDDDADLLFEEVDRIFISLEREALRRTGSQTAGRQFMDQVFDPYVNPTGIGATLGQGKPINAGQRIIQALTGQTPDNLASRGDEIGQQVARALVSQGPELAGNVGALGRYNAAQINNDALSQALAARLRPVGAPLAYQTSMQQTGNRR